MSKEALLPLTTAEALVLSHCLDRVDKLVDESGLLDMAERTALWGLINLLEQFNPVIFSDQYDFYIRQAKTFLTRSEEDV